MAKSKAEKPSAALHRPKKEDITRAIAEVSKSKKEAAEYNGFAGAKTQAFTEKWGISKKAFGFLRQLSDMEADKRTATLRDFTHMAKALGFFDQPDMFDDAEKTLTEGTGADEQEGDTVATKPDGTFDLDAARQKAAAPRPEKRSQSAIAKERAKSAAEAADEIFRRADGAPAH